MTVYDLQQHIESAKRKCVDRTAWATAGQLRLQYETSGIPFLTEMLRQSKMKAKSENLIIFLLYDENCGKYFFRRYSSELLVISLYRL